VVPTVTSAFLKAFPERRLVDRCDKVMTIERRVPSYLMEIAIPIEKAAEAVRSFREITLDFAKRPKGERFFVSLPAQIRFIRGDRGTMLSAGEGRDTCWFGVGSYIAFNGSEPFFREMEDMLLALGGRPHWGKLFYRNPRKLYDRFERFDALRKELDPSGKFENKYITLLSTGQDAREQF
jgi:L-gulonolactone oxidase